MRVLGWVLVVGIVLVGLAIPGVSRAAAPDVALTVTVNPPFIVPGEATLVRIRLLRDGRVLYPATGTFIVNVTITTLGDLALAKRTWVLEEIRDRALADPWPATGPVPQTVVIGTESDIRLWRLPPALTRDLVEQLRSPAPRTAALIFGRTTEFFLIRGEKGTSRVEFSFAPGFASGTFFIFAEIKGKPASSAILKLERTKSHRMSVVQAAPARPVKLRFEYGGREDPLKPPQRPFKYLFKLRTDQPVGNDCEVGLSVPMGPMEFKVPRKSVWLLQGEDSSVSFLLMSKEGADLSEQQQVRVVGTPQPECGIDRPAVLQLGVPPRFVRKLDFRTFVSRVPGNGQIPVELTVTVRDDLGSTPTPEQYGFNSVILQLVPELFGRRFGWLNSVADNPKIISDGQPIQVTWRLAGIGHFSVVVKATVRRGDVEEEYVFESPLGFYFPWELIAIGLLGGAAPLIARKRRRVGPAILLSEIVLLAGFLGILREGLVQKSLLVDLARVPWYFDVAAGVVALAVGYPFVYERGKGKQESGNVGR